MLRPLATVEVSWDYLSVGFAVKKAVAGGQKVADGRMKGLATKQEGVQTELDAHSRVALVVGKLNVGDLKQKPSEGELIKYF